MKLLTVSAFVLASWLQQPSFTHAGFADKSSSDSPLASQTPDGSFKQYWHKGRALALAGKPLEAVPFLERAMQLLPTHGRLEHHELLRDLGAAYVLTGQHDLGIKVLSEALDAKPTSTELLNLRAAAYSAEGRYRKATKDLTRCTELNPKSDTVWVNLGSVLESREKYQEAVDAYNKALDINPASAPAQLGKATMQARLGLYQDALPTLEKLAADKPTSLPYQLNLALAYYHTESLTAAAEAFGKVLKIDASNVEALTLRGITFYRLGNNYSACRDWTKAASLGDKEATSALKKYCSTKMPLGGAWGQ